jgi:hypothetical protein
MNSIKPRKATQRQPNPDANKTSGPDITDDRVESLRPERAASLSG